MPTKNKYINFKNTLIKLSFLIICLIAILFLNGCTLDKEDNTNKSSKNISNESSNKLNNDDIPKIEEYLNIVVNGNFRELNKFPFFTQVSQIPALIFSSGNMLDKAAEDYNKSDIPRLEYQEFLQNFFSPSITLPSKANYIRGYNADKDTFTKNIELSSRNFYPSTFWKNAQVSQEGNKIYFDAYEFNYEFVNTDNGSLEYNNPISRIVVDDVTIGFSVPLVKRDLYLLDYKPLAKTRYTLELNSDNQLNLLSKTRLEADEDYKFSAMKIYNKIDAKSGITKNLSGSSIAIVDAPRKGASMLGTLLEGTKVWYLDIFPDKDYYLYAPSALSGNIFNYKIGFGYGYKEYIG